MSKEAGRELAFPPRPEKINGRLTDVGAVGFSARQNAPARGQAMAEFSALGSYKFVYKDDGDEEIICMVVAANDDDAIKLARKAQHGLALEVWTGRKCLERLPCPERFDLWGNLP